MEINDDTPNKNNLELENFYYDEWQNAEKDGNIQYAEGCKEQYRTFVMDRITQPYHWYKDELKEFEMINLN